MSLSGLSSSKALALFLIAVGSAFIILLLVSSNLNQSIDRRSIIPCDPDTESMHSEKIVLDFAENDLTENGLEIGKTGVGGESAWSIVIDEEAPSPPNVLAQSASDAVDFHFPYVIIAGDPLADADISVKFKAISGGIDQAAGIIFRFVDSNNYYVLRANALENNIVLFKFVDGERPFIASAPVEISQGDWYSLRAQVVGECIKGYFDDALVIETEDSSFREGLVGLWTKADSITYFDDLIVEY